MADKEKLIELLDNVYLPMTCGPDVIGEYHIPHKFKKEIADHLIANGVTFAKDNNVPAKVIQHKVDTDHIRVGTGLWGKGTTVYRCPKCQIFVMRYCKFCFECGQALDWQTEAPKGE